MDNTLFIKAYSLIKNSTNILVATHDNPDGDAIGSMVSLYLALRSMGKKVYMALAGEVPDGSAVKIDEGDGALAIAVE